MKSIQYLAKKYNCQANTNYSQLIQKYVLASENQDIFSEEAAAGLKENVKEFFKKAILPAALLVGPVACGPSGAEKGAPHSEEKAEQLVNKEFSKQGISCDIKKTGKGQVWTFLDKNAKDAFKLTFEAETQSDGLVIVDYSEPMIDISAKTPRMKNVQNSLVDYFSEQGGTIGDKMRDVQKQYSCEKDAEKVPTHVPSL